MSLNIQTNVAIPQNNLTFNAKGKGIRTVLNNATGDVFIQPKRNFVERINTRLRGYINKFKETFGTVKCKNTGDELSKDEAAILSKEELACLSKESNPYDFLTKEEQAIWDSIQNVDKPFEELTQEEKNVCIKHSTILQEICGSETPGKKFEQSFDDFERNVLTRK